MPLDAPGVARGPVQQTIMADGQTGVLEFDGVRLGPEAVVGREGRGMDMAFLWINWARVAARRHVQRARGPLPGAVGAPTRASGGPSAGRSASFGAVAERLSDIYMDWRAMRALSLEILARLDEADVLGEADAPARPSGGTSPR